MTDEDSIAPSFSDGSLVSSDFDEIHSEPSKSSEGETHSNTSGTNNGDSVLQSHDQENKLVRSSKACVYAFLLVVAIGGSLLVWAFLRQVQQVSVRKQVGWTNAQFRPLYFIFFSQAISFICDSV